MTPRTHFEKIGTKQFLGFVILVMYLSITSVSPSTKNRNDLWKLSFIKNLVQAIHRNLHVCRFSPLCLSSREALSGVTSLRLLSPCKPMQCSGVSPSNDVWQWPFFLKGGFQINHQSPLPFPYHSLTIQTFPKKSVWRSRRVWTLIERSILWHAGMSPHRGSVSD